MRERERERGRQRQRDRERQSDRETGREGGREGGGGEDREGGYQTENIVYVGMEKTRVQAGHDIQTANRRGGVDMAT